MSDDAVLIVPVKPWWKSRTVWANVLATLASILLFVNDSARLIDLPPHIGAWLLLAAGIINIILRTLVNQPIDASASYTTKTLRVVNEDGEAKPVA